VFRSERDRLIRFALRDRFAVTMTSGETVEGVLFDVDDRTIVLADAAAVNDRGTRTRLDGWVYLPRAQVLYLQRPHETPGG